MYYLGELARKPCTKQEVLGSNPAGCKNFFSMWDILSRFYHPEAFVPEGESRFQNRDKWPYGTGTKVCFCSSV